MRRAFVLMAALLTGCTPKLTEGGEDLAMLQDPPQAKAESPVSSGQLLPLRPGNYWNMRVLVEGKPARDQLLVEAPLKIGSEQGLPLKILREGKLWRVEVYQNGPKGLRLLAFGQDTARLLVLQPPFSLSKPTIHEGDALAWKGTILLQGKTIPATGYSRVTLKDNLTTRMGRLQTYRVDSIITMHSTEGDIQFPNARWLTPGIGFLRRGYADAGKAALSEMESYRVGAAQ